MKYSALFIFCLVSAFIIHPVSAASTDAGVEMVAKGIDKYMELRAEKNLDQNFGVNFGNTSGMELTPSQKLVYMIATAEQHPLKIKWVRDTFTSQFILYYKLTFLIICLTFVLELLQKIWPEKIAGMFHAFTGHDGDFDYSVMFITSLKLAFLPIFALPIIEFLFSIEQMFSNGLMKDSIEYVSISSSTSGIFFYESIAYGICGPIFASRIQYLNEFSANVLIVIVLLAVVFTFAQKIGALLCAWFLTALFVRPVTLWYSCEAVKDIASKQGLDAVLTTQSDMTAVVILSFLTVFFAVFWPVFMLIMKVVCDYISYAVYKGNKLSQAFGGRK
jgi:hypothetical protein